MTRAIARVSAAVSSAVAPRRGQADACSHPPHEHAGTLAPRGSAVIERAAAIFRSAGEEGRLRLLERLLAGEHCVSEIAAELGDRMSTISERLRLLRSEGLVRRRREGKHMYYSLADEHIGDLIRSALDHAVEERFGSEGRERATARARAGKA